MDKYTPTGSQKKIAIFGIGNFGYAILKHLDKKADPRHTLFAFDVNKTVADTLRKTQKHPYLHPTVSVSKNIQFPKSPQELVKNADIVVLVVPSEATREVVRTIKNHLKDGAIIVNTAKALDYKTSRRLSEIIKEELRGKTYSYAFLAGGTIASDLFKHEPLGVDVAGDDKRILPLVKKLFQSPNLSVYTNTDLTGLEYAAAFKNVISILAGIIKGMGFSYGSETHVISRAAYEMERIVTRKLGGKKATFSMKSQCWGNDLWMSCTGNTRNRQFGILLGQGLSPHQAIKQMKREGKTVEGVKTIAVLNKITDTEKYPLTHFLHQYIAKNSTTLEALKKLIMSNKF